MDAKTLWNQITSPGDSAVALIGYALGFAADVFYFPGGESSGITAAVWSIGALGLKKGAEVVFYKLRGKDKRTIKSSLTEQTLRLSDFIRRRLNSSSVSEGDGRELKALLKTIKDRTEIWEAGLLDEHEFEYDISKWRRQVVQITSPSDVIVGVTDETRILK